MAMDFVRQAGVGQRLGKTRTPALLDWKSVASAAPFCGETPTVEFDESPLVRTRYIMSGSCQHCECIRPGLTPLGDYRLVPASG